jgi:hypothetical protein
VIYFGLYEKFAIILSLKRKFLFMFSGYIFSYALDPYVVLSPAGGGMPNHKFLVKPFSDGRTEFL